MARRRRIQENSGVGRGRRNKIINNEIANDNTGVSFVSSFEFRYSNFRRTLSTMVGHGIDIVETARIRQLVEAHGQHFLDRCFTPA